MAVTTTSVIRIGTASLLQIIHSVVSRLYPSMQRLHMGPLVPSIHPSWLISEVLRSLLLLSSLKPMQSLVYGHLSNVMLSFDQGTRQNPCFALIYFFFATLFLYKQLEPFGHSEHLHLFGSKSVSLRYCLLYVQSEGTAYDAVSQPVACLFGSLLSLQIRQEICFLSLQY